MIRQPSSFTRLYAWHKAAICGEHAPRHEGWPECGWFKMRYVKNGPWVPVRIFVDRDMDPDTGELTRDENLRIEIEGIDNGDDPARWWTYLTTITQAEFNRLMDAPLRDPRMMDGRARIDLSHTPTHPKGFL